MHDRYNRYKQKHVKQSSLVKVVKSLKRVTAVERVNNALNELSQALQEQGLNMVTVISATGAKNGILFDMIWNPDMPPQERVTAGYLISKLLGPEGKKFKKR